ncbi:hypothetical protein FB45DRAFT_933008 [Roridomyces roridus]|uniref:Uncharacterized protein n=1 Tax=Roridomyces roridus TaxID=1738132 RepID=A0AAD7FDS8_9AGAR|nr:hypothetical protein FB45DRAFT_933008 [Roridomyces roridus]
MTVSDADRFRIAVALTALKFKPADQSCASYVLHLRSIFPPSAPAAPTTDGSWKSHALALEKDLEKMKEKYQAEQISHGSQPVKRKPKKKTTDKIPARADLETVLASLDGRPDFVCLPDSESLFSNFSALNQLTFVLGASETAVTTAQRSLLVSTAVRCITTLSVVLHPILRSTGTTASQATTLHTLTVLLHHLTSSSIPLLFRKSKSNANSLLNKVLDALITFIFNPILESFSPLSHRYLASLFSPTSSDNLPTDLRPDVLRMFQSGFSPLVSIAAAYELDLQSTLALTALRELEGLFPEARVPWTHDSRVNALARKDALWYTCTALHTLFGPIKDCWTSSGSPGAISEGRIADAFSRIVSRCRGCRTDPDVNVGGEDMDEVGYGMILGIMERFWAMV